MSNRFYAALVIEWQMHSEKSALLIMSPSLLKSSVFIYRNSPVYRMSIFVLVTLVTGSDCLAQLKS